MLHWALLFFLVSIIAGLKGHVNVSALAGHAGFYVVVLFIGLYIVSLTGSIFKRGAGNQ